MERQTNRRMYGQTIEEIDRCMDNGVERQTEIQMHEDADGKTDRYTDRQTDREINKCMGKLANR